MGKILRGAIDRFKKEELPTREDVRSFDEYFKYVDDHEGYDICGCADGEEVGSLIHEVFQNCLELRKRGFETCFTIEEPNK